MTDYDKLFHYMLPTDAMERISKEDFISTFDDVIDTLEKENKGIVITNKGKDDLVLCPSRWFAFCFDNDFGCIINSALRYVLPRKTYMPEVMVNFIRKYIDVLDGRTLIVAIRDIENALKENCVETPVIWEELKMSLTDRIEEIEREGLKD